MAAALRTVRAARPGEIIVAVPVASHDRLEDIRGMCDRVVCLIDSDNFWAIGQFYREFAQVPDERVVALLREFTRFTQPGEEQNSKKPSDVSPAARPPSRPCPPTDPAPSSPDG